MRRTRHAPSVAAHSAHDGGRATKGECHASPDAAVVGGHRRRVLATGDADPAAAAATTKVYGGATRPDFDPIVLTVRGGRVVRLSSHYETPCGPLTFSGRVNARISRRGRFSIRVLRPLMSHDGDEAVAVERVSGTIGARSGAGTAVVELDATSPDGEACASKPQRWTVEREAGRVFAGDTSQDHAVVVRLNRSRSRIAAFQIGWTAPCREVGALVFAEFLLGFPVVRGRFGDDWRDEAPWSDGGRAVIDYHLAGRITRDGKAFGSFRAIVTVRAADGTTQDTCTSPTIRWSAGS